jgi:hypothetical protein
MINGPYKTELIKPRTPWRTIEEVELAAAEWVHLFNHRRLYQYCGDIPPAEMDAYYPHHRDQPPAEFSHQKVPGLAGAVQHGSRCGDHLSLKISSSFIRRLWSRGNAN